MGRKSLVFVRGINRPEKQSFVQILLHTFNPDNSHVSAAIFSLSEEASTAELRAAGRTLKNHVKRMIINGTDPYIIINTECLSPQHWQSYQKTAEQMGNLGHVVGIDVWLPGKILTPQEDGRSNLQRRNLTLFKAQMTKYFEYRFLQDDPAVVARAIREELKEETQ